MEVVARETCDEKKKTNIVFLNEKILRLKCVCCTLQSTDRMSRVRAVGVCWRRDFLWKRCTPVDWLAEFFSTTK